MPMDKLLGGLKTTIIHKRFQTILDLILRRKLFVLNDLCDEEIVNEKV